MDQKTFRFTRKEPTVALDLTKEFIAHPLHVSYTAPLVKRVCDSLPLAIKHRDNFWTVGSASYKDRGVRTKHEYEEFVKKKNSELLRIFPDLYRYLLMFFEHTLNAKVKYLPDVSIPGFHVFKYCKDFEKPLARPHVDVPYDQFDWGSRVGKHTLFTVVAPVEIPQGAGMYVWDYTSDDLHKHGIDEMRKKVETEKPEGTVLYRVDQMIMHSGLYVHQIKPFVGPTEKWRITLQLHAVLLDDVWRLYW